MFMKILVVEDEHRIANSIKKGLEQEGCVVDVAYDGETGFDLASTGDYEVIVLDLMLPKMNGIEICEKLREEEKVQTPVLMLTARGELEDKVKGFKAGADDYLVKPFAFVELLARVRALSKRPKNSLGEVLKVGELSLDRGKFEAKRGERKIELSKKEFGLLEYLMRNVGKVMSKDQIINQVWSYEADVLPNTVEVYMGYLRKKIDKKEEKPLLKTKRGFGYKIEE